MNSQSPVIRLFALSMILTLVACGGGGGGSSLVPDNGVTPVPGGSSSGGTTSSSSSSSSSGGSSAPTERDITVSVTGTSGTVVVRVAETELTFTGDGTETLTGVSYDTDVTATIVSAPVGETCLFAPSQQDTITVDLNAAVECGGPSINGFIKDFVTDDPIASATIYVFEHELGGSIDRIATLSSGSDGSFTIDNVKINTRTIIWVQAPGYARYSVPVVVPAERPIYTQDVFLTEITDTDTQMPTADMNFVLDGVTILKVPADGLRNKSGEMPVGSVTAEIALLDGSADPRVLPGQFQQSDGSPIEVFAGLWISLKDESGNLLELADGVTAVLSIPVSQQVLETVINNQTEPYTFGRYAAPYATWIAEVAAAPSFEGITRTLQTSVTNQDVNFDETYTIGLSYPTADISGCMIDLQGNRVAGVQVITQGKSYIGTVAGLSDANGNFLVKAKADEDVLIYGLTNTRSRTVEERTIAGETKIMDDCILIDDQTTVITLTWGENPSDLDSQLFGPTGTSGERFHIYYVSREATVNGVTMFLDVDDTTSFGPEVTTIPKFPLPGVYEFFVDLFAGTGTIRNSPARVEVNAQGNRFIFSPGSGTVDKCWHVFDIEVDDQLKGTVIEKDDYVAETVCDTGLQ